MLTLCVAQSFVRFVFFFLCCLRCESHLDFCCEMCGKNKAKKKKASSFITWYFLVNGVFFPYFFFFLSP